ncbi:hypothetical protein [Pontibacter anaerobius]|uniref:Uncharacterized protein n=1 Tax=Pontibacter anaerobius TaxID=2993940 RepID=A0ABT3RF90_9BACT|nr:hypothetical protein [Pontibacter anaerobius]MCX2740247.1 hypothetical protein [Pontibacter anaerobius]
MKTNDKLQSLKYGLLYFLSFFLFTIFLKLWDTWENLLNGEAIDWQSTLSELDLGAITAIALPIAVALGSRKAHKTKAALN